MRVHDGDYMDDDDAMLAYAQEQQRDSDVEGLMETHFLVKHESQVPADDLALAELPF